MYDRIEEVDYCSAAGILIPRRLFLDVGGFDEFYLPAYYEDVDLAFKTRAAGKRVYFQPAARIVHVENASSDFARAAAQAAVNQLKFHEKWAEVLSAGGYPSARHPPRECGDAASERITPALRFPGPRAAAAYARRPDGPKTLPP
jgi:hypothetical protein